MLWILGAILAALGLYSLLARRSLVGWLIGGQLIFFSVSTFFMQAGLSRDEGRETQIGALYVAIFSAIFVGVMLGLTIRQFILAKHVGLDGVEKE